MELFQAEVVAGLENETDKTCPSCGERLKRCGTTPSPPVPQFSAFLLAEIEGCNTRWVFDEADDGKLLSLDSLDLHPGFAPLRLVGSISAFGDNAFPVQLGCMLKHHLPVPDQVFGIKDWHLDVVFPEKVEQSLAGSEDSTSGRARNWFEQW